MNLFQTLAVLGLTFLGSGAIFLVINGKGDKKTWLYLLGLLLAGAALGAGSSLLLKKDLAPLFWIILIAEGLYLGKSLLHLKMQGSLFWSRRDSWFFENDGLFREFAFTLLCGSVSTLAFLGSMALMLGKQYENATLFWCIFLVFIGPFFFLKSFDFLHQRPQRVFSKKWRYSLFPELDENTWKWENLVIIRFSVKDSLANQKHWFAPKALFRIRVPREQPLFLIYRLALREYHKGNPSVPIQDLGYEENTQSFWWMFYLPFIPWKPRTWFRMYRYLDPNESIAQNDIKNGDLIVACRIPD